MCVRAPPACSSRKTSTACRPPLASCLRVRERRSWKAKRCQIVTRRQWDDQDDGSQSANRQTRRRRAGPARRSHGWGKTESTRVSANANPTRLARPSPAIGNDMPRRSQSQNAKQPAISSTAATTKTAMLVVTIRTERRGTRASLPGESDLNEAGDASDLMLLVAAIFLSVYAVASGRSWRVEGARECGVFQRLPFWRSRLFLVDESRRHFNAGAGTASCDDERRPAQQRCNHDRQDRSSDCLRCHR